MKKEIHHSKDFIASIFYSRKFYRRCKDNKNVYLQNKDIK